MVPRYPVAKKKLRAYNGKNRFRASFPSLFRNGRTEPEQTSLDLFIRERINAMLAIIGAMVKETEQLFAEMTDGREERIGFTRLKYGTLEGVPCVLACSGVGKVHAAVCSQIVLDRYPITALINFGIAGALDERLSIGDCVVASDTVQYDIDTSPVGDPVGMISGPDIVHIPADQRLTHLLKTAAENAGCLTLSAAIATGDQFLCGRENKLHVKNAFGAAACDMEGGAIAQVAWESNIPYAAYRTVSDTLCGNGREYEINARDAAEKSRQVLKGFLLAFKEDEKNE